MFRDSKAWRCRHQWCHVPVVWMVRTIPVHVQQGIMMFSALLLRSQTEPSLLVALGTADKFIAMTNFSTGLVWAISIFWSLIVVFQQHSFCQRNLLPIDHDPNVVLPFPSRFSSRMLFKRSRSQLVYPLESPKNNHYRRKEDLRLSWFEYWLMTSKKTEIKDWKILRISTGDIIWVYKTIRSVIPLEAE